MNYKTLGDIGQKIAIGELAKYNIDVALPISDNLPFDFISIIEGQLYRTQVKATSTPKNEKGTTFPFKTNNFYTGKVHRYTKEEIDLIIGVDLRSYEVYLFDDFEKQNTITLREEYPDHGQKKGINLKSDYMLSDSRLYDLFSYTPEKIDNFLSKVRKNKQYDHVCKLESCKKSFSNGSKNARFCSPECSKENTRKVERPSKETLEEQISTRSYKALSREYGVSDNAIRKWARSYGIID